MESCCWRLGQLLITGPAETQHTICVNTNAWHMLKTQGKLQLYIQNERRRMRMACPCIQQGTAGLHSQSRVEHSLRVSPCEGV